MCVLIVLVGNILMTSTFCTAHGPIEGEKSTGLIGSNSFSTFDCCQRSDMRYVGQDRKDVICDKGNNYWYNKLKCVKT